VVLKHELQEYQEKKHFLDLVVHLGMKFELQLSPPNLKTISHIDLLWTYQKLTHVSPHLLHLFLYLLLFLYEKSPEVFEPIPVHPINH
jgi:hypothetical protein